VNVAFRVQAHPSRALIAAALAERIGGDVVYDPDPENPIPSPWRTLRHLLETAPEDATHICSQQDDVEVCTGYRAAVEKAVAHRPDRILCFHVGAVPTVHGRAVLDACARDESWALLGLGLWIPVVATCWPVEVARAFLAWDDAQFFPPRFVSDDERLGRFCQDTLHRPLASVPSLAEHPDQLDSLIGGKGRSNRRAVCWIGECADGCVERIDWSTGAL
jgi:hypothetical protein